MSRLAVAAAALLLAGCSATPGAGDGLGFTGGDGTFAIVPSSRNHHNTSAPLSQFFPEEANERYFCIKKPE